MYCIFWTQLFVAQTHKFFFNKFRSQRKQEWGKITVEVSQIAINTMNRINKAKLEIAKTKDI